MKKFLILFLALFSTSALAYNTPSATIGTYSGHPTVDFNVSSSSATYGFFANHLWTPADTIDPNNTTYGCWAASLNYAWEYMNFDYPALQIAPRAGYTHCENETDFYMVTTDTSGSNWNVYDVVKVHNSGTDTSPVWSVIPEPFLGFPLQYNSWTADTATISAVVDHSNTGNAFNCSNGVVTAYTGEQGVSGNGTSNWSTTATGSGCSGYLYGLAKASGTFSLGGQYDTSEDNEYGVYLFYDGHTGYDYPVPQYTEVYAAADGTIASGSECPANGSSCTGYGQVGITHTGVGLGYSTWYLHLDHLATPDAGEHPNGWTTGETIHKGELLGYSGNTGTTQYHLHFTVKKGTDRVDPYGWTGTGADPLQIDGHDNICLWDACP